MKLCGCLEECFERGDKVWGHMGGVMCLYMSETVDATSICHEDEEVVKPYFTEKEYQEILKNQLNVLHG